MKTSEPSAADRPSAVAAAITLAVVGVAVFMALPIIVGSWADIAGFGDQRAGWLAAAESAGGIIASLLVSRIVVGVNRRKIAVVGILVAAFANMVSIFANAFEMLALCRVAAGAGSGTIYALGLATLAGTTRTGRNFSILLFAQVTFGMVEINVYPYLADLAGMPAIYVGMACTFCACLFLVHLLPSVVETDVLVTAVQRPISNSFLCWLCLVAIFTFYLAAGSFWAYVERIGTTGGLRSEMVTAALTYTQVLSLVGCVIAGWLSVRVGQSKPLLVSLSMAALAIFSLTLGVTALSYIAVLSTFFLVWNAIDIYQLGTLSNIDHSGRFAAMVPAFQQTAISAGPALAALLLGLKSGYLPVLIMSCTFTVIAMLIYSYVYAQLRLSAPELADAA